ncbi:MAG TPA: hypothetical protein VII00_00020 [bacterium]
MRFILKTIILFIVVILLGYVFLFRKDFVRKVGVKTERVLVNILKQKAGTAKKKDVENKKRNEDITEDERRQIENIIEERGD